MKIVFICGSLEVGRDGVGDYTRRFSAEVIRYGHQAAAISLSEKNIQASITEKQYDDKTELQVLRISAKLTNKLRFDLARRWIADFEPEWISLQFVPYSFNSKGICFGLGKRLKRLGENYKWHIMIHELWIGRGRDTNWKHWFVSQLQKMAIKGIGNSLLPNVIHTQLPVFYSKLEQFGWSVKRLPLFSNIPVVHQTKNENNNVFVIGFFSQVEISESITAFINTLALQAQSNNIDVQVVLIGGNEARMKAFGEYFQASGNLKLPIRYTGFLEADELTKAIQNCDMGITPIPRHALGKSGSVAAFISYGIPVAAPNVHFLYDEDNIGFFTAYLCQSVITQPGLDQWKLAKEATLLAKDEIQLSLITTTFLSDLRDNYKIQTRE